MVQHGSQHEAIQIFAMANLLVEHGLDQVEDEYGLDLRRGHLRTIESDAIYYPQIEQVIRAEAARMAPHYEVFYSLEKTIRGLIADVLTEAEVDNWWEEYVPEEVRKGVGRRRERELDSGTTPRSAESLDFTTFGELGEIIKTNWDLFGGLFSSVKAVENVMAKLNNLRGPIAHCSPLAEDEVLRLRLSVRDWFRLME